MELWQFLGDLHPKLVQFPLVLLLCGLLFDLTGLIRRSGRFHWAALILSCAGTLSLLFAFICGIYAEIWAGRAGVPQDPIEWHEFLANISSWGFVLLIVWRLFLGEDRRRALIAYTTIGLGFYSLLVLTAYFGGQLVFHYGAAVTGAQANTVLSLHDLNTLATRQTDLNLKYSELMHHVFGWLTLALSGSLLAYALFPKKADRLKWVAPALLLAGGVFLFFFADLDLYRLTDPHQWRDREVQLHKTMALVLVGVGIAGLRRRRPKRDSQSQSDIPAAPGGGISPSKVVAVMALIGGAMLFTHVHTVAPYANVAAGVYIAHVVLGLVALSIGATRLMQDALPRRRPVFAIAFAALLCVESVLLITYNEGLPWYIGYGRYNRWGPHGGTVAPYGNLRAELTFSNDTQLMDVYLLDRMNDQPREIAASEVNVLVGQGYHETAVTLRAADRNSDVSHFTAQVPWLRDAASFSARLALPVNGSWKMGYFDPWVAPVIAAVPPNEVARFQCPMHDGILAQSSGVCPICGMALVPIQKVVRTNLHDPNFNLLFDTSTQYPQTASLETLPQVPDGRIQLLKFTPQHDGSTLGNLPVVHEHPLHLTIVSRDLQFFDHVHPIPQPDGSLQLLYHFPEPGNYLLYAEFMPRAERPQIFRIPMTAGADPPVADPVLQPESAPAKSLTQHPDITVELIPQPRKLTAGTHAMLLFRLARNGQPITDLEPYMGAMGHCAIISEDTQTFLHCHPEQLYPPTPQTRGGPDIAFHALFPKSGRYKIWAQFQRDGRVIVADFVVQVDESILPPRLVNFILNDY